MVVSGVDDCVKDRQAQIPQRWRLSAGVRRELISNAACPDSVAACETQQVCVVLEGGEGEGEWRPCSR